MHPSLKPLVESITAYLPAENVPETHRERFIAAVAEDWPLESISGLDFYSWKEDGDRIGCVMLEISEDDETTVLFDLVKVTRPFIGLGYGSRILDRVCELADEHGVALQIDVQPDGTTIMDVEALTAFYERRGFTVTAKRYPFQNADGPTMSRPAAPTKDLDTGFDF